MIDIIKSKIKEHERVVDLAQSEYNDFLDNCGGRKPAVNNLKKALTLKDRLLFHKSAILTLQDLLETIEKDKK